MTSSIMKNHSSAATRLPLCVALVLGLASVGCLELRQDDSQRAGDVPSQYCVDCHGDDDNGNSAPPPVYWDRDAEPDPHQPHLVTDSTWHKTVPCEECHLVPADVTTPGHIDTPLPAELTWGTLASTDGATPAYDFETKTCTGVYCHGETFASGGGSVTQPEWAPFDDGALCGTCHGTPPGLPHPQRTDCSACHTEVIDDANAFVDPSLHIDGQVQLGELTCVACHGSDDVSAPPLDLEANSETTEPGVGAHRAHLGPSEWHSELSCTECHLVPTGVDDPGHIDTPPPADLTWGELAATDGAEPSYDYDDFTCSGVYCHGDNLTMGGGSNTTPDWTVVDGSQSRCGTCHGVAPAGGHVQRYDCATCHGEVIDSDFSWVAPGLHINGQVEVVSLTCTTCHGSGGFHAPPLDTRLNGNTTDPGVGAHRAHLVDSDWHLNVMCDECHTVPMGFDVPGHYDTPLPAELTWGHVATADDAAPEFVSADTTCVGTYCHGATFANGGGTAISPDWTQVDGSQAVCGSCHSTPPGAPHPNNTNCSLCHGSVIDSDRNWVDSDLHINGTVNF